MPFSPCLCYRKLGNCRHLRCPWSHCTSSYGVLVGRLCWAGTPGRIHSLCRFDAGRVPEPQQERFQLQGEQELGPCPWVTAAAAAALHRLLLPRDAINRWAMDLTASHDVIRKPIGATAEALVAARFMVLSSIMRDRGATGTVTFFPNEDSGVRQSSPRWQSALTLKAIISTEHFHILLFSQALPHLIFIHSLIYGAGSHDKTTRQGPSLPDF